MSAAAWAFLAVLVLVAAASVWLLEQTPDTTRTNPADPSETPVNPTQAVDA